MSIKFRPITKADKGRMAPTERCAIDKSPIRGLADSAEAGDNNVVSQSIFGKINRSHIDGGLKEYEDKYTRVGYIDLTKRVLNPFLAGRKAPVWRLVLGLSSVQIVNIVDGRCFYDLVAEELVAIENIGDTDFDEERYLVGADILEYLLDKVDINKVIENELISTFLYPIMSKSEIEMHKTGAFHIGDIYQIPKDQLQSVLACDGDEIVDWIFADYAIDLTTSDFSDIEDENQMSRRYTIRKELYNSTSGVDITHLEQFPLLSLLISMKSDAGKESLKSQILDYIFVLPYGYRPTIDKRVDVLTSQYNKLVNSNQELRDILDRREKSCFAVANKYREVVQYIRNIFIGDDNVIKNDRLKNYKSLSDSITGKEGLMRGRMQGTRVDNSARTVITCDPEMPIDTIGVPKKILAKVAEPSIIRDLRKYNPNNEQFPPFRNKNLSRFSTTSSKERDGITYEEYMEHWFKEKDRYGLPGRQPTLFYLGIQGFKIIPVDGDAIVLSPLIVMPFNADFDGDQMHFNMAQTPAAIKEVKERMAFTNNYRYPKNGELTVVTRHEIIYGLWMAHKQQTNEKSRHWTVAQLNEEMRNRDIPTNYGLSKFVYDCVCKQVISVYDTVDLSDRTMPAGVAALEFAMTGGGGKLPFMLDLKAIVKFLESKHTSVSSNYTIRSLAKSILQNVGTNVGNTDFNAIRNVLTDAGIVSDTITETIKFIEDGFSLKNIDISAKFLTNTVNDLAGSNSSVFLSAINRLVRLGFSIARIWPPNVSTIVDSKIKEHVKSLIDDFTRRITEREELVNVGLEIESEYTSYFNEEWNKLRDDVTKYLLDNLDSDNGYIAMMKSGGKGDKNNIQQIFGLKGRVQKNDTSAFNSIITGCYSGQLTGLEGFVSAYGSRKGISDKVLATAKPGYLSRKLEHAGTVISITYDDCGTTNGIAYTLEDIVPFLEEAHISKYGIEPANDNDTFFYQRSETIVQFQSAVAYLSKLIVGRYIVTEDGTSIYVEDKDHARKCIENMWGRVTVDESTGYKVLNLNYSIDENNVKHLPKVIVRSPIYCQAPCCKKCYGKDIAAGTKHPMIGRPVGFIAAQAIGEPGTQMTMKNFQKGGVVTDANLTSSFELIEDYLELHDFSKKKRSKKGVYNYDIISPVTGYVKEQHLGNGAKRIIVTKTNKPEDRKNLIPGTIRLIVHENTKLKEFVRVGDSFQKVQGYLNIKEVLRYRGYDKAAMYLTLMLNSIFETQDVNIKHFECIVAAMSCAFLLSPADNTDDAFTIPYGKGSDFKAGSVITRPEFCYGTKGTVLLKWTLIGLKTLPKFKADFLESILMENMDSYIPRAILMNPNDSMSNPITCMAFGLPMRIGSDMSER